MLAVAPAEVRKPITDPDGRLLLGPSEARLILRECFELFRSNLTGIAKLSIETSNDLFEMDPLVAMGEIVEFKEKRGKWVVRLDEALKDLFAKRMSGQRRTGRRPDAEEELSALQVMGDIDQNQQSALRITTARLVEAAKQELDALDYRVAVLFGDPPSREVDNPFSPAYLLDAIGMTSRSLYTNPRIWRPLMERVIGDFVPAINKTYIKLNRFLAERGVLPEVSAMLRARSELRPGDDKQLLPVFSRLINEVHSTFQAWRIPGTAASPKLILGGSAPELNPYLAAVGKIPSRPSAKRLGVDGFPQLDTAFTSGSISPVVETLDHWQRSDPFSESLRSAAPVGIDARVTPINRIPWIQAAVAPQVGNESDQITIDVVGFLFDYIFRDPSIPAPLLYIFDRLQITILKAALVDQNFFADKKHPARRLLDNLAAAAIGATDDPTYRRAFESSAIEIVEEICAKFHRDAGAFDAADRKFQRFVDDRQRHASKALGPHVATALAAETGAADRSHVRAFLRDKLAGLDIPFDVRAFTGTVWGDYLTQVRQREGGDGDSWRAAVQTMDDMLWTITAKERTGQKARLSKMIPPLIRGLRAGAAAVKVSDEKMKRFLDALYDLHIAAIKPVAAASAPVPSAVSASTLNQIGNVHDFVADLVFGTWLAFHRGEAIVNARLSWISPLRTTYIFTGRSEGGNVLVFTPEELGWEVNAGKAELVLEPVPLFDRAVSVALEFLAVQKAKSESAAAGQGAR